MSHPFGSSDESIDLRLRATARLAGSAPAATPAGALDALSVLYQLASSPSTAQDALTLLHELQVHQVELAMQDEELRESRTELESNLRRQTQLYDFAPVGYYTIDTGTVVHEINLKGARLLGFDRDALLGRPLENHFIHGSAGRLRSLLAQSDHLGQCEDCGLELRSSAHTSHWVRASAVKDPAGQRYLLALTESYAPLG